MATHLKERQLLVSLEESVSLVPPGVTVLGCLRVATLALQKRHMAEKINADSETRGGQQFGNLSSISAPQLAEMSRTVLDALVLAERVLQGDGSDRTAAAAAAVGGAGGTAEFSPPLVVRLLCEIQQLISVQPAPQQKQQERSLAVDTAIFSHLLNVWQFAASRAAATNDRLDAMSSSSAATGAGAATALSVGQLLFMQAGAPQLAFFVHQLNCVVEWHLDKQVAKAAADVLLNLIELVAASRGSSFACRDWLAFLFPGTASTMARVVRGDFKRGLAVKKQCFRILATAIAILFLSPHDPHGGQGGGSDEKSGASGVSPAEAPSYSVARTDSWKKDSAVKASRLVRVALEAVSDPGLGQSAMFLLQTGAALHLDELRSEDSSSFSVTKILLDYLALHTAQGADFCLDQELLLLRWDYLSAAIGTEPNGNSAAKHAGVLADQLLLASDGAVTQFLEVAGRHASDQGTEDAFARLCNLCIGYVTMVSRVASQDSLLRSRLPSMAQKLSRALVDWLGWSYRTQDMSLASRSSNAVVSPFDLAGLSINDAARVAASSVLRNQLERAQHTPTAASPASEGDRLRALAYQLAMAIGCAAAEHSFTEQLLGPLVDTLVQSQNEHAAAALPPVKAADSGLVARHARWCALLSALLRFVHGFSLIWPQVSASSAATASFPVAHAAFFRRRRSSESAPVDTRSVSVLVDLFVDFVVDQQQHEQQQGKAFGTEGRLLRECLALALHGLAFVCHWQTADQHRQRLVLRVLYRGLAAAGHVDHQVSEAALALLGSLAPLQSPGSGTGAAAAAAVSLGSLGPLVAPPVPAAVVRMLEAHADYVIDCACRDLHIAQLQTGIGGALHVLLDHASPAALAPLLPNLAQSLLDHLELCQQQHRYRMPPQQELVSYQESLVVAGGNAAAAADVAEGSSSQIAAADQPSSGLFIETMQCLHLLRQVSQCLSESLPEPSQVKAMLELSTYGQDAVLVQLQATASAAAACSINLARRCKHASRWRQGKARCVALVAMKHCLETMCRGQKIAETLLLEKQNSSSDVDQDSGDQAPNWILPNVHQMWAPLVARLRDPQPAVFRSAVELLVTMAQHAGQFISSRFASDALPVLASRCRQWQPVRQTKKLVAKSGAQKGGQTKPQLSAEILQLTLFALHETAAFVELRGPLVAKLALVVLECQDFQPVTSGTLPVVSPLDVLGKLVECDADAMWPVLFELSSVAVGAPDGLPQLTRFSSSASFAGNPFDDIFKKLICT